MDSPRTLQDIISEGLKRHDETKMKELYRENTRRLEAQRANDAQYGGNHYKKMGVEPWDVVDTWPIEQQLGYHRGGALKYLMRMGSKDAQLQEVQKALHYVQKLIEVLEKADGTNAREKG